MRRGSSGLNLILGIDKPLGMSSHDVVNRVRRILGERRVGHAGTLDPAATGVLVVGVGQGTRLLGLLTQETKSYLARITFGFETNTDDAEGEPTRAADTPEILCDETFARDMLSSFIGRQKQVPPIFSAISIDGKRSYKRAREGEEVEIPPRDIEVLAADLICIDTEEGISWQCVFTVSKGTYIRALARDVGRRAQSAAHLTKLVRTSSGEVTLASCVTLEELESLGAQGVAAHALDPVRLLGLPVLQIQGRNLEYARSGRPFSTRESVGEGESVALISQGLLVGVWEMRGGKLVSRLNVPQGIQGVVA